MYHVYISTCQLTQRCAFVFQTCLMISLLSRYFITWTRQFGRNIIMVVIGYWYMRPRNSLPKNTEELRRFQGRPIVNYLEEFLPRLCSFIEPLRTWKNRCSLELINFTRDFQLSCAGYMVVIACRPYRPKFSSANTSCRWTKNGPRRPRSGGFVPH